MGCKNSSEQNALEPAVPEPAGEPAGEPAATAAAPIAEEPAAAAAVEASAEERALIQLKVIFQGIDANEDGAVSKPELTTALNKDENLCGLMLEAGLNANLEVLDQLDTNHNGRVTYDEFVSHLKKAAVAEVKENGDILAVELSADEKALKQLKAIFDGLDANHDGAVSKEELAAGMKKDESVPKLIEEAGFNTKYDVLEQLDTNHDGRIAWSEFESHLRSAAKQEVKDHGDVEAAVPMEDRTKTDDSVAPKSAWCC